MKKYRYEFPPLEPHFLEAPSVQSVITFVKRTYPHNFDHILSTLVEVPHWPAFWKVLDEHGRALPWPSTRDAAHGDADPS